MILVVLKYSQIYLELDYRLEEQYEISSISCKRRQDNR